MCSGRIDIAHILRAFSNGIDGVFIGACHLNECNYTTHGNYHTLNMTLLIKKIMEHIGLNPERLRIAFMSGAEANILVESTNDFVKKITALGAIGKGEGIDQDELKGKFEELIRLIPYIKITKRDKLNIRLKNEKEGGLLFTNDEIDELFKGIASYYIVPEKCQACMICLRKCPVDAIEGAKKQTHIINQDKCIKCGTCFEACPPRFQAIIKT